MAGAAPLAMLEVLLLLLLSPLRLPMAVLAMAMLLVPVAAALVVVPTGAAAAAVAVAAVQQPLPTEAPTVGLAGASAAAPEPEWAAGPVAFPVPSPRLTSALLRLARPARLTRLPAVRMPAPAPGTRVAGLSKVTAAAAWATGRMRTSPL